jgi:hypothetical protein
MLVRNSVKATVLGADDSGSLNFRYHNSEQRLETLPTTASKEGLQQLGAATRQYASANLCSVIQLGMVQHFHHRMDGASFWVVRSIHQAFQPGMHQGARAHRTRLNCGKELTVSQAVVPQIGTGLAKGDDFGVSGRVGVGEVAIPASADDLACANHDRAHGDLACFQCALCGAESLFHPEFV